MAQTLLPVFIGTTVLSLAALALVLVMFLKSRRDGKRLTKLLAETNSTLTAIFNTTPDIIFCKDIHSHITECNKAYETHFNVRRADITGKNDREAFDERYPDLVDQYMGMDQKVIEEGQSFTIEEYIPSPDGARVLFETIKTPLIQDGKITGLVGISRDISRRKAAEEEAKNASEAKTIFVAKMNHEMRTPMNVIVGLTDLIMEEEDIPVGTRENLKKINIAATTLMSLINDVLDFSKIEAGKLDLTPVQYDLADLLNDIIALNLIRIGGKHILFKLDINEEMPRTLFGDDLRIKQILNNLLSNAFKYTKKGTVTLGVTTTGGVKSQHDGESSSSKTWLFFYVKDTGIGMHDADIAKIFRDYNQVDKPANRNIEGTGLGLSIAKKFVDLMGGKISVESEYGKGTTFRVLIPQGFVSDTPIGKETAESLSRFRYSDEKKQEKLVRADLSYARVLVVDDLSTNLDVASRMLRKYKMQVDCVDNGKEAVARVTAGNPVYNAVFMDHMMPEMDGVEAVKLIRALGTEYAKNVPVIALTANAVVGSEQMYLENGFSAFLPKPFNAVSLDAVIQQWVRAKES